MSDRPVPYPPDTRSKGWRFELDLEQIDQSDTWALTPADIRPWLLMLWAVSWRQTPCGSLPDDDELISVRLGMDAELFAKHRAKLLRGWWKADDGRLYHDTLVKRVTEMLALRDKEKNRKADYRKKREAEEAQRKAAEDARNDAGIRGESQDDPNLSHGTREGQTWESHGMDNTRTSTRTSTRTGLLKTSVPDGTDAGFSSPPEPRPIDVVFAHWQTVMESPRARLDDKREKVIKAALKTGYTVGELCKAIDGCRKSPFHMGRNDNQTKYNGLNLILRNAEHIDRFMGLDDNPPQDTAQGAAGATPMNRQEALEASNRAVAARLTERMQRDMGMDNEIQ